MSGLARQSELLPDAEPRIPGAQLVMPSIRSLTVGQREGSGVRQRVNALQQLNFGDGLLSVHCNLDYLMPPAAQARAPSGDRSGKGSPEDVGGVLPGGASCLLRHSSRREQWQERKGR
jgi:hypothetical protein